MPGILVFSEDAAVARQTLGAALKAKKSLDQPVTVVTTDDAVGQQLKTLGADKIVVLRGGGPACELLWKAVADLAVKQGADLVLVGGTLRGKDLAARLAAVMKCGLGAEAMSLSVAARTLSLTRVLYGGLAQYEVSLALPAVVTIAPQAFPDAPGASVSAPVDTVTVKPDPRVTVADTVTEQAGEVNIATAMKLVSAGRGFAKKDDLSLADSLAKALGAEVACSRPVAEDLHWLPMARYVGISGQTVAPHLYLAVGISGQVQHLAGIRGARVIAAVNIDPQAPIFEAADYGIVGDLYEVLPLLTKALAGAAGSPRARTA